ncbi:MAG TPA: DUF177 domain-containing protein [Burkholderiales bacterium]|nr:DUF177 domain-containing protein [Burkholderiales bacterium]
MMISSAAFMSHQPVIDGFQFASAGATQRGTIPASAFSRLRDWLASDAGEVAYEVVGLLDERGRPSLRVRLEGRLELRCQRCLESMTWTVRHEALLVLAATQAEIDADPRDTGAPDRVLADKAIALAELVEDELVLEVPYAPRHEGCTAAARGEEEMERPFAGLRGLLGNRPPKH